MKSLKEMCFESFQALYNNPGNDISLGLANHLTPIGNIVNNVSNLFSPFLGIVAEVAEDQNSLKIYSSRFWSERDMMNILYETVAGKSLYSYIIEQGLTAMSAINLGQHYVAYFYAQDVNNCSGNPVAACSESYDGEAEIIYKQLVNINEDEIDLEDEQTSNRQKEILKLFSDQDQVKTATEVSNLYNQKHKLPQNWTIRALKDEDGNLCVALRQAYKRETFKGEADAKRSWVYIYGGTPNSIWVPGLKNPDALEKDVKTEVQSFLQWLGAEQTNKPTIYTLPGATKDNKKKEDDKKYDKKDDKKETEQENNKNANQQNQNNINNQTVDMYNGINQGNNNQQNQ